jgi:predicted RNA binding protein YcfA (HicA-like mRNA interferase family)
MKAREVERLLMAEGWFLVPRRGKGSHRHYRHPLRKGTVTVPWHQGEELRKGTLESILKPAGLK